MILFTVNLLVRAPIEEVLNKAKGNANNGGNCTGDQLILLLILLHAWFLNVQFVEFSGTKIGIIVFNTHKIAFYMHFDLERISVWKPGPSCSKRP